MHFSKKKSGCPLSASPEILAFMSYYSANFQPNLDYFVQNFKLMYKNSENMKVDRVNTVVYNLHQIKRRSFFFLLGHLVFYSDELKNAYYTNTNKFYLYLKSKKMIFLILAEADET